MKMRKLLFFSLFTLLFLFRFSIPTQAFLPQDPQDENMAAQADSVELQPFPVIGITEEFGITNSLINESGKTRLSPEEINVFRQEVDTLYKQIDLFKGDSSTLGLELLGSRELDQLDQQVRFFSDQIEGLLDQLSKRAAEMENSSVRLREKRERWQLTLNRASGDETLESRADVIRRTIRGIDSVSNLLQNDLVIILDLQDGLAYKRSELRELSNRINGRKAELGETLWKRDVPGYFKELRMLGDVGMFRTHLQQFISSVHTDVNLLRSAYMQEVIMALIALIALLVFARWFRKNHEVWIAEEQFKLSELHLTFINSPVVSSLFFVSMMLRFLVPDLPRVFYSINMLILLITMAILMVRVYGSVFRTWIIVLVTATSVLLLYDLAYHPGILLRTLLLAMCFVGIWLYYWIHKRRPYADLIKHRLIYRSFRVLIVVFLVLQFLSIISNLAGAFRLAEFFALIPFRVAILAIAIQLFSILAETIIYLALASNYVQKLHVAREEFQVIYRKSTWLVDFILLLTFIGIALDILMIKDRVVEWGRGVLNDGIKIGEVDITLASIAIFIFVIWISIMISRIISRILEKDVFTRVKAAKGMPSTIILLLKIVLISGGFFLAAAASGMHLTNLSIVLGAFSVGIGFGLQNIFNNMVSGLILAFERPIKVGDVVQVGELLGTVRSIGLRSSTVKSFDGAEVIVPNGNLISNEMINWTLSDSFRRMDLRVGVAYGTDPDRVLEIMETIANEHDSVMKKPVPKAYFIEFGDSSLNFRLLAWADLDNRLEVESEINVLINQKLAEAGIEIPFPQHDLHIRSDHTKAEN